MDFELDTTIDHARNAPKPPLRRMGRENVFQAVDRAFLKHSVVFVEGEVWSGKTEFAAEFMRRNDGHAIAAFLSASTPIFYSVAFARQTLAEQMYMIVNEGANCPDGIIDDTAFSGLLLRLQRLARRRPFTFVIDGLSDKEGGERQMAREILKILPLGQTEFRFLVTGSAALFQELRTWRRADVEKVLLFDASLEEARQYLADLPLLPGEPEALYQLCGGIVGVLDKVRGLLIDGVSAQSLLTERRASVDQILEIEWEHLPEDANLHRILAFLAWSQAQLDTGAIADLAGISTDEANAILEKCRLVRRDSNSQVWSIRADAQRRFIMEKLDGMRVDVEDRLIARLLRQTDSEESTVSLPPQLITAGRHAEALQRLTSNHFERLLSVEGSLRPLRRHAEFGLTSARKEGDLDAELRFALIQASVSGASIGAGSSLEIEALMALGQDDEAAALALGTEVAEERVQRLAVVAACFRRRGKSVPSQVDQVLRDLLADLCADLPDGALERIASELLAVDIDLALDVVARLQRREIEGRLAVNRQDSRPQGGEGDAADQAGTDVPRPKLDTTAELRPFFEAAATLVNGLSADDVLAKIEPLAHHHKLFVLVRWLERHKKEPDAVRVAVVAIRVALADTSRAPRVKDFREIAVVAPHISLRQDAMEVIERLDAQRRTLRSNGTTDDTVRLEMLLLRAKQRHGDDSVEADLIGLHHTIGYVNDIGIRTTCYAWMLYHLEHLANKEVVEANTAVISETTRCLLESIDVLLQQTAEHYQCAKEAIRAICKADRRLALNVARKLNTVSRREDAYVAIAHHIVDNDDYNEGVGEIYECIEMVQEERRKENLIVSLLDKISKRLKERGVAPVAPRLLVLWKSSKLSYRRLQSCVLSYEILILTQSVDYASTVALLKEAEDRWLDIHVPWLKADVAFWVITKLAPYDQAKAREWLLRVRADLRGETRVQSAAASNHLFTVAALVARTGVAMIDATPNESKDIIYRLEKYIDAIPLLDSRVNLWNFVAVSLHFQNRRDLSARVVKEKIEPIISQDFDYNNAVRDEIIATCAPSLYLNHAAAANAQISRIASSAKRDSVRASICDVIFRKQCVSQPFQDRQRTEHRLTYAEATDIIALLKEIDGDAAIYAIVTTLCDSLMAKKNRSAIRRNQVADVLADISTLVGEKLPNAHSIRHDGYLIACQAQILRCRLAEGITSDRSVWQDYLSRAETITNVADRVVVVSIVASCAGATGVFSDNKWFERISKDILSIPSDKDRIERFRWVAEILEPSNKALSRRLLMDAMNLANHLGEMEGIAVCRQKMLDLAHNIEPEFCTQIIEMLDRDEAKVATEDLKQHSKLLDCRREAANDIAKFAAEELPIDDLAEIAWRNLAALNAGRQRAQTARDFLALVEQVRRAPLPQAFPIWLWIMENAIRKATQQSARRVLPSLFDMLCNVADVTLVLVGRANSGERMSALGPCESIGPGDRETVYQKLREWVLAREMDEIRISDPFFGPEDLDIIKAIADVRPDVQIKVLTSKKQMLQKVHDGDVEEAFRDAWDALCEQPPPPTEIIIVGFGRKGDHPIHDRWIVAESTGLRLGTSANSLGFLRVSEMSELSSTQARERGALIDQVLSKSTRDWQGQRLNKSRFEL